jgi:hypothetical protein
MLNPSGNYGARFDGLAHRAGSSDGIAHILAAGLKRLRKRSGYSISAAAGFIEIHEDTLIELGAGELMFPNRDLLRMAKLYRMTAEERTRILKLRAAWEPPGTPSNHMAFALAMRNDDPALKEIPGFEESRDQEAVPITAFICYSSEDRTAVRDLHHRLSRDVIPCWFDERDLHPGQAWDLEISKAIRASKYVLACLSKTSVTKRGYVQKELKKALDVADEQPEGVAYLIPVRLEECEIPERLRQWQWVDLFQADGYARLVRALRTQPPD